MIINFKKASLNIRQTREMLVNYYEELYIIFKLKCKDNIICLETIRNLNEVKTKIEKIINL